jgi:hypothetical protein
MNKYSQLLEKARERAQAFIELRTVAHYLRAYECGSALDPLFKWSVDRTPEPRALIVLQDWYLEEADGEDSGTVESNVEYTEQCFLCDPGQKQGTFSGLFHTGWSRAMIENESYLVFNAVWGLRRMSAFKGPCGILPNAIHTPALDLWLWLATEFKPAHIYLCGCWARNGKEFGPGPDYAQAISVSKYFDCWPKEAQKREIVSKARVALIQTEFHSLPHPAFHEWKKKTTL